MRTALEKVDKKGAGRTPAPAESTPNEKAPATDVRLSNVAEKAMAETGFDRAKVESIKQALQDGQYAINPRRIAESFVALERMIDR